MSRPPQFLVGTGGGLFHFRPQDSTYCHITTLPPEEESSLYPLAVHICLLY